MAGPIIIKISPGETKSFSWSLLSNKNETEPVSISANGDGAQLLSFPNRVNLTANKIVNIPVLVNIPENYTGNSTISPTIRASETTGYSSNASTSINVEMAKVISIKITSNKTS
jgi:hypothetical protein